MKRWYVIQIKHKHEKIAIDNLANQGFVTFNPHIIQTITTKKQSAEQMTPLFAGYMFVRFDIKKDQWKAIGNTRGVYKLLSATDERCDALPKGFVEQLRKRADVYGQITAAKASKILGKYGVGENVRIIDGQFEGFTGVCTEITRSSATVIFTLLNNKVQAKLLKNQVTRVPS